MGRATPATVKEASVRTVGVDLAAQPLSTALCAVEWQPGRGAQVAAMRLGAHDGEVLAALGTADRAAIDCPLGWPEPFVDFVVAHRHGHVLVPAGSDGLAWRRTLSRRTTDVRCEELTGVRPLSVSADRIAAVAMRGAGLLGVLASRGEPVDRSGGGTLVETYPAAALEQWGLPHQTYKGPRNVDALGRLVDAITAAAPWLDLGPFEGLCRTSEDAFDALVCALVARAAQLGAAIGPSNDSERAAARAEGWIVLPLGAVGGLADGGS